MTIVSIVSDYILAIMAIIAGIVSWFEYKSHKEKEDNKLFSQLNRRYEKNRSIQRVVRYLRDVEATNKEPNLYELELFLRFFEELGLYMETNSIDIERVDSFFGYYLKQLYKTNRGRQLLLKLGLEEERKLDLLQYVKLKLGITMKTFNPTAQKLVVYFENDDEYIWEIDEIPCANIYAESIRDSENSTEVISEDENYRAVLYVNTTEGNIEIFNNETDEEITEFTIKEIVDEEIE